MCTGTTYPVGMRWDGLFDDLEAQWADLDRRALVAEAAELTRGEWARLGTAERLRGGIGRTVRLHLLWGEHRDVRLDTVGVGWVGGVGGAGGGLLVPLASLAAVEGDLGSAAEASERPSARAPLSAALRRLARARAAVRLTSVAGAALAEGTLDRVGADHVDIARHARDEARRREAVRGRLTVPFSALGLVADAGGGG